MDVVFCFRVLRTNEDIEVKTIGLQLQDARYQKKSNCCTGGS